MESQAHSGDATTNPPPSGARGRWIYATQVGLALFGAGFAILSAIVWLGDATLGLGLAVDVSKPSTQAEAQLLLCTMLGALCGGTIQNFQVLNEKRKDDDTVVTYRDLASAWLFGVVVPVVVGIFLYAGVRYAAVPVLSGDFNVQPQNVEAGSTGASAIKFVYSILGFGAGFRPADVLKALAEAGKSVKKAADPSG
jgi:hypothetical protein